MEYSARERSLKCPYCGAVTEIPKSSEKETPGQVKAILPLSVSRTDLVDAVYEHLASGDLTPDNLLEHATFTKTESFYVPAYIFTGDFEAKWTASFGYDRKEQYTIIEERRENGRTTHVPVTKTKTVTDWRPASGTDSGNFSVVAYGGKRLLDATVPATDLVEGSVKDGIVEFDASFITGVELEDFAASEADIYKHRARPQINSLIDNSVEQHAQGDRQKDWHWTAEINKECISALLPICHAVYEFEAKAYHVWVSGNNVAKIRADALPVDKKRKNSLKLGYLPLGVAAISSAFAVGKLDAAWMWPAASLALALLFSIMRRSAILGHSRALRQALLASKRTTTANTAGMSTEEQQKLAESVRRPGKSLLANTSMDGVVVPVLALLLGGLPFLGSMTSLGTASSTQDTVADASTAYSSANASSSASAQVAAADTEEVSSATSASSSAIDKASGASASAVPKVPAQPVQEAASSSTPLQAQALAVASVPAQVATPASAPSQAQTPALAAIPAQTAALSQQSPTPADHRVAHLLSEAAMGNWQAVDADVAAMAANPRVAPSGDRSSSRAANRMGLAALQRGNTGAAVSAFEQGLHADPSDIEVRNNYAYALIKALRPQDAVSELATVLEAVPTRTSAWANLAEALSSINSNEGIAALKLAVHFSSNRDYTRRALQKTLDTAMSPGYRAIVSTVLAQFDNIPPSTDNAQAVANAAPPSPAIGNSRIVVVVQRILADGRMCFNNKQYSCAITDAKNALSISPNNTVAIQLKQAAEAAQAQALHNIQIQ
ncbi:tetratricopeptide repeat protein [Thiomonas sp. X19]|uniref:tetratricopeptide repeat protein n=1 Tax=Thiomonas sp. X19 TaxID=1050370 RepID=UPI001313FAD5|nr:tetratricopeptide repeat protein [Thiomonas sp. X19]